jgi:hypothetical protein
VSSWPWDCGTDRTAAAAVLAMAFLMVALVALVQAAQ